MPACTVYIIYSKALDRCYVGLSEYPRRRLRQHNHGTTFSTRRVSDWQIVWQRTVDDVDRARALEKRIKARGAARFLADEGRGPADAHAL
jgi:putative endonuclease